MEKNMKIVIPVDKDRQTIFKRTGRAPLFAIYENNKFINNKLKRQSK